MIRLLLLLVVVMAARALAAQSFLNGSFEDHSFDQCGINLPNLILSDGVENTVAFGEKNEIDLLSDTCGDGPARDGGTFLALNSIQSVDALSLELAEALVPGKRYAFTFFQQAGLANVAAAGVEIGLSETPDQFGQQLYGPRSVSGEWTEDYVAFTAPVAARYITVRATTSWVFIDHFAQACPRELSLGPDTTLCDVEQWRLEVDDFYDSYTWQDGSGAPVLVVDEPGLYWIEVSLNSCTVRDSILIGEYPNNCRCQLYVPAAFSPNFDGVNDEFAVATPCELSYFELLIFNRWGAEVFRSPDPHLTWKGSERGRRSQAGVYPYIVRYQFNYQDKMAAEVGTIHLVR